MFLRNWFRPPRHLLAIFLVIVLLPSALLVVSGWRLMMREETLALQERQAQMADLITTGLRQRIDGIDAQLRNPDADFSDFPGRDDFVFVVFNGDEAVATPARRLLYYPVPWRRREVPSTELADAQHLHRAGDVEGALAAWARVARLEDASVAGIPASLFARWAECDLLEEAQRTRELKDKAGALYVELHTGRWQLDHPTFDTQVELVSRWVDPPHLSAADTTAGALSAGVEWLFQQSRAQSALSTATSGRELFTHDGQNLTVLWHADGTRLSAFVAGPAFVDTQWLAPLTTTAAPQQLQVALRHPSDPLSDRNETRRPAAEYRLPWTVAVASSVPAGSPLGTGRFRVWIAGVAVLSLMVVGGTIVIARAARRELAVAQLQADFVSAVSHEFRTPLTSLRQIGEVLHDGRVSDSRRRTYYEAIGRQTQRLHHLVETLLDFGRMEAGRSPYRKEPFELVAWAQSVVDQFNSEVEGRGYTVTLSPGEPMPVVADAQALTNALWNLLDNAVKYSPDCKTVTVALRRNNDTAVVEVRDRGLGIPANEQNDIFGKFVRGAEAKRQNIAGTGIGLAMVQHIVKAHDGRVRVESQPGAGSTFFLELPCHAS